MALSFRGLSLDIFQWHRKRKAEIWAKILNQRPNVDNWQSFLDGTKVCKVEGPVWEDRKSVPCLRGPREGWGKGVKVTSLLWLFPCALATALFIFFSVKELKQISII